MKKMASILLILVMVFVSLPSHVFAKEETGKLCIYVNPYGHEKESEDTITWHKSKLGVYYLFLPSDCDPSDMTVFFDKDKEDEIVKIGKKVISNGAATNVLKPGKKYVVSYAKHHYSLRVMKSQNIPALYINTEESLEKIHANKEFKSKGKIISSENGEQTLNKELKHIKGHGNSTYNYPKKSYNIKFDKKTNLLNLGEAKKFVLLANYLDPAFITNPIAWELYDQIGLPYGIDYEFADLYINGDYMGTYTVCESVEVGKNRINIADLTKDTEDVNKQDLDKYALGGTGINGAVPSNWEKSSAKWTNIPTNPENISGGYILECDYHGRLNNEASYFVTDRGQGIVIKEPEFSSKEQVEYIRKYWQSAEDAICSKDGYNKEGHHYSEYFDIDSFVDMYILLELSGNGDAGISSTFFYKDKDGKIKAGPIWDNDTGFGNFSLRGETLTNDPTLWIVGKHNYNIVESNTESEEYPTIYNLLFARKDFKAAVDKRWDSLKNVYDVKKIHNTIDSLANRLKASGVMNSIRWTGIGTTKTYLATAELSKSYIKERIKNLNKGFSDKNVQLYYDLNGGKGWTKEHKILVCGDRTIVNGPYNSNILRIDNATNLCDLLDSTIVRFEPPQEGAKFLSWNTKPDGSGKKYLPGDTIKLTKDTTLYAQWSTKAKANKNYPIAKDNAVNSFAKSLKNVLNVLKPVIRKLF